MNLKTHCNQLPLSGWGVALCCNLIIQNRDNVKKVAGIQTLASTNWAFCRRVKSWWTCELKYSREILLERTLYRPAKNSNQRHCIWGRLVYNHRCGGQGLQNRAEEHRMDRQEDVVKVGNGLLLNECVDKVFSNQTGDVFSLNITGQ